jgi:hypothetical protein
MTSVDSDFNNMMNSICYQLGQMAAKVEDFHNCKMSHLRYPWPLDPSCDGCRHRLEKFVKACHLEIPYLLFGWDSMIDHLIRDVDRRARMAEAYRNQGSGI